VRGKKTYKEEGEAMGSLLVGGGRTDGTRGRERWSRLRPGALWLVVLAGLGCGSASASVLASDFDSLVSCRWAVEEVYWSHRIWPESNPGPKPALAQILAREAVERRMDDALRQVTALEEGWNVRMDGAVLQRELERMAHGTKDPAMLAELFAAAGGGEGAALCLALPELAKSRLVALYAEDLEIHRPLREQAEAALESVSQLEALADLGAEVSETVLVRSQEGSATGLGLGGELELDSEQWSAQVASLARAYAELDGAALLGIRTGGLRPIERASELPVGRRSRLVETPEAFVVREVREASEERLVVSAATWRKRPVDLWWQERRSEIERAALASESVMLPEITATPCVDDTWTPTAVDYLPAPRLGHAAVWTGAEMWVFGGYDVVSVFGDGAIYSPATDSWAPFSSTGAPSPRWLASAVWTGQMMLIWGGASTGSGGPLATGARYSLLTESWSPMVAGPAARYEHVTVWTGTQMIVWGGVGANFTVLDDGSLYSPSNAWQAMATTGRPSPRFRTNGVWAGTQMIVWGGQYAADGFRSDGKLFTPGAPAGSWESMSSAGAPAARSLHTFTWTGPPTSRMVVWGGLGAGSTVLADGGRFAPGPGGGTWEPMATSGAPSPRFWHTATWTGEEMVVFGGSSNSSTGVSTGARYDPAANLWTGTTSSDGAPAPRYFHSAVWTGEEVIVWGGYHSGAVYATGGRYDPDLDSWTPTSTKRTPTARVAFASKSTGAEVLVWGGLTEEGFAANGALFRPATGQWAPISDFHGLHPVQGPESVWTGLEFLVWGGWSPVPWSYVRNGGRYAPATDSWLAIPETGAPLGRAGHTAIWTGSDMVVWGGLADGGRYTPGGGWNPLPAAPLAVSASGHSAVWTGSEMIVWGGTIGPNEWSSAGARYRPPPFDTWIETALSGAPSPRVAHTAVWTGSMMIVWGGYSDGEALGDGAWYRPDLDLWGALTPTGAPESRRLHEAVWTGAEMIVWGGNNIFGESLASGGKYLPSNGSWESTSMAGVPAPRLYHAAERTSRQMFVWGGQDVVGGAELMTGGLYCTSRIFLDGFEQGDTAPWTSTAP